MKQPGDNLLSYWLDPLFCCCQIFVFVCAGHYVAWPTMLYWFHPHLWRSNSLICVCNVSISVGSEYSNFQVIHHFLVKSPFLLLKPSHFSWLPPKWLRVNLTWIPQNGWPIAHVEVLGAAKAPQDSAVAKATTKGAPRRHFSGAVWWWGIHPAKASENQNKLALLSSGYNL